MIDIRSFADRPAAVFGLGRGGRVAAAALAASGARVWAWDDNATAREQAAREGLPLVDLYSCDWSQLTTLVLSPGIPHTHPKPHPVALLAHRAGCEIIGDIELLVRSRPDARYIGITGTNGKSTTTALIGHLLTGAGRDVEVGGNIGIPVLGLRPLGSDGIYVLELSSYQLELTPSLHCDVAVLLNITPDHLGRHGGMEGYVEAKRLIFKNQRSNDTAVVGTEDEHCRAIIASLSQRRNGPRVIPISGTGKVAGGVFAERGSLYDGMHGNPAADLTAISTLPGVHNWQNAAAAFAAARTVGIERDTITRSLATYPGLNHRQERIAVIDGVAYVNDSKATNADAAEKALVCYDDIYWIAGGQAKEGGIESLLPHLGRIRHAYLIGECGEDFARTLDGKVAVTRSGTLAAAIDQARKQALTDKTANPVVLLSPAAASFDQFKDFEDRGRQFRALVEALPGNRAAQAVH